MRHAKRGQLLGLSLLAVLSAMAMIAASAQASGELRVEGKVLTEGVPAEFEGESGAGKLLVTGLGLEIECEKALLNAIADNLNFGGFSHAHGQTHIYTLFHGCKVVGNKFCVIYPSIPEREVKANAGLILSTALLLERLTTNGLKTFHYVVAKPLAGNSLFTTIYYTVGKGCTLPSETPIGGSSAVKLTEATTEAKEHTLESLTILDEIMLEVHLTYGEEKATIDGGTGHVHLLGVLPKWSLN